MQLSIAFVLLCLCLSAVTEASFSITAIVSEENTRLTPVTKWEQLWRFQVGRGKKLTLGDRYICLASRYHRFMWISESYAGSAYNCGESERFEVEFVEGNRVRLKSPTAHVYVACSDSGDIRPTDWDTPETIFELSINDAEDQVVFYNAEVMGTLSLTEGHFDCNGYISGSSSRLHAWKEGPKEAWEASDEWQMIGYFDNRYSDSTTKFVYETAVGLEDYSTTEASVDSVNRVEAGPDARKTFVKSIGDTDVGWSSTPPNVWEPSKRLSNSIEVAPKTLTKLYQAVGHYGIYTIRSMYFQARDEKTRTIRAA